MFIFPSTKIQLAVSQLDDFVCTAIDKTYLTLTSDRSIVIYKNTGTILKHAVLFTAALAWFSGTALRRCLDYLWQQLISGEADRLVNEVKGTVSPQQEPPLVEIYKVEFVPLKLPEDVQAIADPPSESSTVVEIPLTESKPAKRFNKRLKATEAVTVAAVEPDSKPANSCDRKKPESQA